MLYKRRMAFDLDEFVSRQMERDVVRTRQRPWLLERKNQRMAASSFAFLRGTAPFFYDLLSREPWLAQGPSVDGWIAGDLHLENFGAFRTTSTPPKSAGQGSSGPEVVFDINDFDEASQGPLHLDLLRLATSVLLAVKGHRQGDGVQLITGLVETYSDAFLLGKKPSSPPKVVRRLVESAEANTTKKMLARLLDEDGMFRHEGNLLKPSEDEKRRAELAFRRYAQEMAAGDPEYLARLEIRDVAFRVAGTGSLGVERYAILTQGKGGKDGGWLFDMKEQPVCSLAVLLGPSQQAPAQRVLEGMQACLAATTRMLGVTEMDGRSMLVRRLSAQEDKLVIAEVAHEDLAPLLQYLAVCVAAAHRRGVFGGAWNKREREELVDRAILMASFHEAAWRIFLRRTGGG